MAAGQLNLYKLILPNTNRVVYPVREGGAGGGMGCDSTGTPGGERFLLLMNLGYLLHCWGWWCKTFAVQSMEVLSQICKCCLGKNERGKGLMWATCSLLQLLVLGAPKGVTGFSYWPAQTFCVGFNTNSWLDTRIFRHVPKGETKNYFSQLQIKPKKIWFGFWS